MPTPAPTPGPTARAGAAPPPLYFGGGRPRPHTADLGIQASLPLFIGRPLGLLAAIAVAMVALLGHLVLGPAEQADADADGAASSLSFEAVEGSAWRSGLAAPSPVAAIPFSGVESWRAPAPSEALFDDTFAGYDDAPRAAGLDMELRRTLASVPQASAASLVGGASAAPPPLPPLLREEPSQEEEQKEREGQMVEDWSDAVAPPTQASPETATAAPAPAPKAPKAPKAPEALAEWAPEPAAAAAVFFEDSLEGAALVGDATATPQDESLLADVWLACTVLWDVVAAVAQEASPFDADSPWLIVAATAVCMLFLNFAFGRLAARRHQAGVGGCVGLQAVGGGGMAAPMSRHSHAAPPSVRFAAQPAPATPFSAHGAQAFAAAPGTLARATPGYGQGFATPGTPALSFAGFATAAAASSSSAGFAHPTATVPQWAPQSAPAPALVAATAVQGGAAPLPALHVGDFYVMHGPRVVRIDGAGLSHDTVVVAPYTFFARRGKRVFRKERSSSVFEVPVAALHFEYGAFQLDAGDVPLQIAGLFQQQEVPQRPVKAEPVGTPKAIRAAPAAASLLTGRRFRYSAALREMMDKGFSDSPELRDLLTECVGNVGLALQAASSADMSRAIRPSGLRIPRVRKGREIRSAASALGVVRRAGREPLPGTRPREPSVRRCGGRDACA
eukprot:CAMPEP_0204127086 /NCGR_PEP_ID=MMETSP0361-20130328/11384_1 /ASSEMBLY_ACC=CAM_ASM_000343 /TAXON_ID=268821 /ORGANISM="Scrippsiella Hangoei, Strain SHTV-5" /LENGTH=675 /DNA_ID=CAMNT_0051079071 /DNA_START=1 /DNA_END=2026 /DNA_ORIENTATION=-